MTEYEIAAVAEHAIGKRPLTDTEKNVLYASWRLVHGQSFDAPKNLAALEAEAEQKRSKALAQRREFEEREQAKKRRDARVRDALNGAVQEIVRNLRANLAGVLTERFERFARRPDEVVVCGPTDEALQPHEHLLVVCVRAGWTEGRSAVCYVEVRAIAPGPQGDLLDETRSHQHSGSPVAAAIGSGLIRQSGGESVDTRVWKPFSRNGEHSRILAGGFVGRRDKFVVSLPRDPEIEPTLGK
jgi:hypothetical protein